MGTTKNVTISGLENIKIVKDSLPETNETVETTEVVEAKKTKPNQKARGKKYVAANGKLDKTKKYDLKKAIKLVQDLSYSKFDGTVEAHLIVKDSGINASISFPHNTGKAIKVTIFSDKIAKDIEAGKIEFDVLIATPSDMSKLTKFARTLGPKGLMPNPKSGTLTTNPEGKKKELEAGKVVIKTERKAPLVHVGVGKVSMKVEELAANIQALLDGFKGRVKKLTLSATMSPGVKVELEK